MKLLGRTAAFVGMIFVLTLVSSGPGYSQATGNVDGIVTQQRGSRTSTYSQPIVEHSAKGCYWCGFPKCVLLALDQGVNKLGGAVQYSFFTIDSQHAWLAYLHNPSKSLYTFYTEDGGHTWPTSLFTPAIMGGGVDMSFSDERHGGLLIWSKPISGRCRKAVYRTSDGCQNWLLSTSFASSAQTPSGHSIPFSDEPTGLAVRSSNDFWISHEIADIAHVALYHSSDAGRTWSIKHLPKLSVYRGMRLRCIDCVSPEFHGLNRLKGSFVIYEIGRRTAKVTYRTRDGGIHWYPGRVFAIEQRQ